MSINKIPEEDYDKILSYQRTFEEFAQTSKNTMDLQKLEDWLVDFITELEMLDFLQIVDYHDYMNSNSNSSDRIFSKNIDLEELQKNVTAQIRIDRFNEGHLIQLANNGYFNDFFEALRSVIQNK